MTGIKKITILACDNCQHYSGFKNAGRGFCWKIHGDITFEALKHSGNDTARECSLESADPDCKIKDEHPI